ncbi:MAG: acetylornithine deacetylase [Hyphomicrobiaceae bacterium]
MTAGAATEILEKLVAFDTTSCNSNLPIIDYISNYLADYGVESERLPNASGEKANLHATIGPQAVAGVGLSGHTDVVPVIGQDWQTDPFVLTEKNGKLYGRGACDMKGFLACVMAAVPEFQRRSLTVPLHLLFSYDEEIGCTGVRPMIDAFDERYCRPRMVIVGEPTNMTIVDAHKGPVRWSVSITGRPAHSSMAHLGVNSIAAAGELLAELSDIENELKSAPLDNRFSPPYTTLQVTEIKGGAASNIVPAETWFGWEIRAIPGIDPDTIEGRVRRKARTIEARMRASAPEAKIEIERTNEVPAFAADPGSEIMSLGLNLAEQNETFAVSYATEASLFDRAGSPAIICGPGDIAQAHTPNEWIARSELDKCMVFLRKLADWAASK